MAWMFSYKKRTDHCNRKALLIQKTYKSGTQVSLYIWTLFTFNRWQNLYLRKPIEVGQICATATITAPSEPWPSLASVHITLMLYRIISHNNYCERLFYTTLMFLSATCPLHICCYAQLVLLYLWHHANIYGMVV